MVDNLEELRTRAKAKWAMFLLEARTRSLHFDSNRLIDLNKPPLRSNMLAGRKLLSEKKYEEAVAHFGDHLEEV